MLNFKLSEFIFNLFFLLPVSGTDRANGPNNPEIPDWTENEFGNDCHHGYGSRDRLERLSRLLLLRELPPKY